MAARMHRRFPVKPGATLAEAQKALKAQIDLEAESQMAARMASRAGPMKILVFNGRLEEARALSGVPNPDQGDYPLLAALLGSSYGSTLSAVGAAVIAESTLAKVPLAEIDRRAVIAKGAVDAATDVPAATAAYQAAWA